MLEFTFVQNLLNKQTRTAECSDHNGMKRKQHQERNLTLPFHSQLFLHLSFTSLNRRKNNFQMQKNGLTTIYKYYWLSFLSFNLVWRKSIIFLVLTVVTWYIRIIYPSIMSYKILKSFKFLMLEIFNWLSKSAHFYCSNILRFSLRSNLVWSCNTKDARTIVVVRFSSSF